MTHQFIISTVEKINEIDRLFYKEFISEDGIEFHFPYQKGTNNFINGLGVDGDVLYLHPNLINRLNNFLEIENYINSSQKYTYDELVTLGKFSGE